MTITISGLTKSFDDTSVLRGIDLQVNNGELLALLGPSGSGKTTLLRIIAGLDWPDSGQLIVAGQNWLDLPAQKRRIGFVFQSYALFPHMNVRDNLAFGLTVRPRTERPDKAEITDVVDNLLGLLQIEHLADRFPGQLSGGQRQRVALGRALAIQPSVLLLDEPFGALDAAIRRDLRRWLREVHDQTGSTTIFVTHDQEEAFELADRVVVMGDGEIQQIGTADEIHDQPASPFVARFMGGVNELPVMIRGGRALAPGLNGRDLFCGHIPDGPATLFLRPDDIVLEADTESPWRLTQKNSTGSDLRLLLAGTDGTEIPVDLPRRNAPVLMVGNHFRLRPLHGALFSDGKSLPMDAGAEPIRLSA